MKRIIFLVGGAALITALLGLTRTPVHVLLLLLVLLIAGIGVATRISATRDPRTR